MLIAITKFKLPKPVTRDEARKIFLSTAPKYQGMPGLFRKHYVTWEDGSTVGGVYLWRSRADAEAQYTESWKSFVREKYGTEPSITYLDNLITVDNITDEMLTHE